jgi:protease-4
VARGRVWSGRNAEQLGLVDGLGGYRDAIATAAELAGLGDDYEVDYFDADVGLTEALGFRLRAHLAGRLHALMPTNSVAHLPVAVELLAEEVQRLGRLSDPRHIYAYCFACSVD